MAGESMTPAHGFGKVVFTLLLNSRYIRGFCLEVIMREVEVKILDINGARINHLLRKNKAKFVKNVFQQNLIYENAYTKKYGIVVRIRKENKHCILTIKSPMKIINRHKVRDEFETKVNFSTAKNLLKIFRLKLNGLSEIKREYWILSGCSVEICQLPRIPPFLEIEGTQRNIKKAANQLGYSKKDYFPEFILDHYKIKSRFLKF